MAGWLFPSAADRRLLGTSRFRGPMPWVIAIMSFSMMLVAATGLSLANAAAKLGQAIETRYAVEVPDGGERLDAIAAAIGSTPGVVRVRKVPESEMRRTLERWLGSAASNADLPVPALVNFDLEAGAEATTVKQRISEIAPDARISAHRDRVAPLLDSLTTLQWLAFGLVLLLGGAAAAAVVLAARGALDTHRFMIDVMHGIGATDLQVTHLFQRQIALDALIGSIGGAAAGALVLAVIASGAAFVGRLTGGVSLSAPDLLMLAMIPLALTALAAWVARTAVLKALREAL